MDGALWMYALLALTTAPPLVPNAALIASAGALAERGELSLPLVLLVIAGSALAGDAAIYGIGRMASGRAVHWLSRTTRRKAALAWTGDRMHTHGLPFVVGVRFLPSGRLIGGLTAAIVRYGSGRYLLGAGIAETVWASYSVALGYWGGSALDGMWGALVIGTAVSLVVAAVAQVLSRSGPQGPRTALGPGARDAQGAEPPAAA
ncbi:DedA family protein [Streptomyces radicis]|uniref:DedA family protein n=1 Tax=Streptomyces radicis TaxID=1750517 RepID=A0A3A9W602_9ACTN|nr:VTT domain-containing protein [Streptomyces radicis]RKN07863.1 DedA family protein [Streptomyces radicis]RKN20683.1 DedA family protein [Streptomyces radicis]